MSICDHYCAIDMYNNNDNLLIFSCRRCSNFLVMFLNIFTYITADENLKRSINKFSHNCNVTVRQVLLERWIAPVLFNVTHYKFHNLFTIIECLVLVDVLLFYV